MTNFQTANFNDKAYNQISGEGIDRYKTADDYISNNIQKFDINHGMKTLKKTVQNTGHYQTLCSMLFSPSENVVYIVLKRNFNQIWKLSITHNTIETFKGFDRHLNITLISSGISASELVRTVLEG